ncbi:Mitochondrial matrix cochaperone [Tulasnella sp. 418]|nr:Mitochondrial matrix cochaperone [Tulasnella sp. 418]
MSSSTFSKATSLIATCRLASRNSQYVARSSQSLLTRGQSRRWYSESTEAQSTSTSTTANGDSAESAIKACEEKLKAKEEEIADLHSRIKYAQADYVNLQKISAREKEQTTQYAITKFAKELITTVDVLSLALKSVPEGALKASSTSSEPQHLNQLHEGVSMTHRQLLQTLASFGVTPFDPKGEKFDPNMHEALYEAPIPGQEAGTVIDTQKLGYKIKDRILRAAQVGVAREA